MKVKWAILLTSLILVGACGVKDKNIQEKVENLYTNDRGLIHAYPLDQKSEYLSESIGLYMEYLLHIADEKNFHQQYEKLINEFISEQNNLLYIHWKLTEEGSTNALIDDKRIIRILQEGSKKFNDERYSKLAEQLNESISISQLVEGYTVDFYDWNLKLAANRITLSYLEKDSLITEKTFNLLKNVDDTAVFFSEYYDIEAKQYVENNEVHMIDQLLIAINRLDINKPSDTFKKWIEQEWETQGMIYGRYSRISLEPMVEYESLAVYYYLYIYFLKLKEDLLAEEVLQRAEELGSEEMLKDAHFFDYIHFQLMLEKK